MNEIILNAISEIEKQLAHLRELVINQPEEIKSAFEGVKTEVNGAIETLKADNAGKEMAKTITRELDNVFPVFMPDNCDVNDVFLTEGAEGLRKRVGV